LSEAFLSLDGITAASEMVGDTEPAVTGVTSEGNGVASSKQPPD
jgi:hypothetical protein